MKLKKPILSFMALVLCLMICVPVFAIDNVDESRNLLLTVYSPEELKGDSIEYSAYLVAKMDKRGHLTNTAAFRDCAWNKNTKSDSESLEILLFWLNSHRNIMPADTCVSNKFGVAQFPAKKKTLDKGLYLVTAKPVSKSGSTYAPAPFLISIPERDREEEWVYSVTAEPKAVSTTVSVRKVWADAGHTDARPSSVSVSLCFGSANKVYASAVLSAQNNWSFTWSELPAGVCWNVVEDKVPDQYMVSVKPEIGGFVVTNTYVSPKIPQTGQITWPIPLLTVSGLALFLAGFVRYRRSHEE